MDFSRNDPAKLPGQYIVDAMDLLPPCGPDSSDHHLAIDVPYDGTFRVTFRPHKQVPRGWPPRWFWLAGKVERVKVGP